MPKEAAGDFKSGVCSRQAPYPSKSSQPRGTSQPGEASKTLSGTSQPATACWQVPRGNRAEMLTPELKHMARRELAAKRARAPRAMHKHARGGSTAAAVGATAEEQERASRASAATGGGLRAAARGRGSGRSRSGGGGGKPSVGARSSREPSQRRALPAGRRGLGRCTLDAPHERSAPPGQSGGRSRACNARKRVADKSEHGS